MDDITDNEKRFNFGDIVIEIKDGILYGSSALSSSDPEFFTYDIMTQEYTMITDRGNSVGLQLAFGSDNKLYGHLTNSGKDGKWYIIDPLMAAVRKLSWLGEASTISRQHTERMESAIASSITSAQAQRTFSYGQNWKVNGMTNR